MFMETMQVATTLPVELVNTINRRLARTMKNRSAWIRDAILKQAAEEGFIKVDFDDNGDVFEMHLGEVAA